MNMNAPVMESFLYKTFGVKGRFNRVSFVNDGANSDSHILAKYKSHPADLNLGLKVCSRDVTRETGNEAEVCVREIAGALMAGGLFSNARSAVFPNWLPRIGGNKGVAVLWEKNSIYPYLMSREMAARLCNDIIYRQLGKIAYISTLCCITDRHSQNFLVNENKIVSIDNEAAFCLDDEDFKYLFSQERGESTIHSVVVYIGEVLHDEKSMAVIRKGWSDTAALAMEKKRLLLYILNKYKGIKAYPLEYAIDALSKLKEVFT
jgi:hypothetical protein